jgi:predicted DsbA family dithiol-disulfide isomerase
MHWAEKFNKQIALNEKLIKAYFEQGLDINNIDVLLNLTEELGLDKTSTIQALQSSKLEQEVNRKVERLKAFKIRSIPAFIINENTFMSGSHSVGFFEENLSKIINDPENQYALKFKETSDAIY